MSVELKTYQLVAGQHYRCTEHWRKPGVYRVTRVLKSGAVWGKRMDDDETGLECTLDHTCKWRRVDADGAPRNMIRREIVLDAAKNAVMNDRENDHGDPTEMCSKVARIWSIRLGVDITPAQVALMMIDFKTNRAWQNPRHEDTMVDIAGYAAIAAEAVQHDPS